MPAKLTGEPMYDLPDPIASVRTYSQSSLVNVDAEDGIEVEGVAGDVDDDEGVVALGEVAGWRCDGRL